MSKHTTPGNKIRERLKKTKTMNRIDRMKRTEIVNVRFSVEEIEQLESYLRQFPAYVSNNTGRVILSRYIRQAIMNNVNGVRGEDRQESSE
jgi:hypothetical protein